MHRLIKIRIIRDLEHLEEQVRRGLDSWLEVHKSPATFRPAADFYETSQTVRGRRRPPRSEGIRRFIHLETTFGVFERRFTLPIPVDSQGVEARYVDGILEVSLPRREPQTRQIPVKP
jgi:hypothetical protein